MNIKNRLQRARWFLSTQVGFDPVLTVRAIIRVPRLFRDWLIFRRTNTLPVEWMPCLQDWNDSSGNARGEYFWQDIFVAKKIFQARPHRHVDIGSRIDGFVAHVAAFRELDVIDIRPLRSDIPGVRFLQHDMMADNVPMGYQADSVSCLHALEHFGLGRYGDPILPNGHVLGFENLARLTAPGGRLYLSVPIGRPRILFNANRILDPQEVVRLAQLHGMTVEEFAIIRGGTAPEIESDFAAALHREAQREYSLGIFTLKKSPAP